MSAPTEPAKYLKVKGVMKLNPEYKKWKESQGMVASTVPNASLALPVITTMADHEALNEAILIGDSDDVVVMPLAESITATLEMMKEPDLCHAAGMTPDTMTDKLQVVLNKYEVPMGLMNKLMMLSEYDELSFLVDDSGSMNHRTDALNEYRQPQTRWQEAQSRLKEMMEVLAHVPFTSIMIWFLNRDDRVLIERQGREPEQLLQDMCHRIDSVFSRPPQGSTPYWEKIQESFAMGAGRSVARYFFSDGVPNGGEMAKRNIAQFLKNRPHPEMNPVTFLSCTGEDDQVEWMKDAEEIAPYCAESDDFEDETREVIRDQGQALPFTKGFYLIAQLVAAMNPDDLDAMDESVPFTKTTLDNLLGVQHNDETYRHYFHCFLDAQRRRVVDRDNWGRPKPTDQLKKTFNWNNYFQEFLRAPLARDIPAVQQFKAHLRRMDADRGGRTEEALGWDDVYYGKNPGGPCCFM